MSTLSTSDRQVFILAHPAARQNAARAVMDAPEGHRVEIKPRTRSLDANAKMWAMLADVSRQIVWPVNGKMERLSPEDWKAIITASLAQENRMAVGIQGGFVMLGKSTSKMTISEMSEVIEFLYSFGADRDVVWSDFVGALA